MLRPGLRSTNAAVGSANVNAKNNDGATPLHVASWNRQESVVVGKCGKSWDLTLNFDFKLDLT